MASGDVIKQFLISLGFEIEGGRDFIDHVGKITVKVAHLGDVVEATSALVVAGIARMAEAMEDLYYVSRRTGASVDNIQAFGYAAAQMGSSVSAARNALEGFGYAIRGSPGLLGVLQRLGVQTRDSNNHLRDTTSILMDLGARLRSMPMPVARAYAGMFGIDERTLFALMEGMGQFSAQYRSMLRAAGMDSQTAAKNAHEFMVELRSLGAAVGIIENKAASRLYTGIGTQLVKFRDYLLAHSNEIVGAIDKVAKIVLWLARTFTTLLLSALDAVDALGQWFSKLDTGTKQVIEAFGALIIAWKILNSAFLFSPIGIILTLIAAMLLLWQDYQTWKAGGKSLIDWKAWEPDILKAKDAILWIIEKLNAGAKAVGGWKVVLELFATYLAGAWAVRVIGAITKVASASELMLSGLIARLGLLGLALLTVYEALHISGVGDTQADRDAAGLPARGDQVAEPRYTPSFSERMENVVRNMTGRTPVNNSGVPERIYREALRLGLQPFQAAALVAHAGRESNFDPSDTTGDNGQANALFQWHPDRQADFFRLFHKPIATATVEEQVQFKLWELQNTRRAAGQQFFAARNAQEASDAITQDLAPNAYVQGGDSRAQVLNQRARDSDVWLGRLTGNPSPEDRNIHLTTPPTPPRAPQINLGAPGQISANLPSLSTGPLVDPSVTWQRNDNSRSIVINQTNDVDIHSPTDPQGVAVNIGNMQQSWGDNLARVLQGNSR